MSITLASGQNRNLGNIQLTPEGVADVRPKLETGLSVSPKECYAGAIVDVRLILQNYGTAKGVGTVSGTFDSIALPAQSLILDPGIAGEVAWAVRTAGLQPGIYTARVGELSSTMEVLPTPVETGSIFGTILVDGKPMAYIGGQVVEAGRVFETDAAGKYQVTGLPPFAYTVDVSQYRNQPPGFGGFVPQQRTVTVIAGQSTEVNFNLQALPQLQAGEINGDIYDAETGDTKAYGTVRATLTLDGTSQSWTQDVVGAFYYFQNLRPSQEVGYYTLKFSNSIYFKSADGRTFKYVDKTVTGISVPSGHGESYDVTLSRKYYA